jgi:hypothetical protein
VSELSINIAVESDSCAIVSVDGAIPLKKNNTSNILFISFILLKIL